MPAVSATVLPDIDITFDCESRFTHSFCQLDCLPILAILLSWWFLILHYIAGAGMNQDNCDRFATKMAWRALLKMPVQWRLSFPSFHPSRIRTVFSIAVVTMYDYHSRLLAKSNIENSISPTVSMMYATGLPCGYAGFFGSLSGRRFYLNRLPAAYCLPQGKPEMDDHAAWSHFILNSN